MAYIDGFVIPVPTANRQAFIDNARTTDVPFDGARMIFGGFSVVLDV